LQNLRTVLLVADPLRQRRLKRSLLGASIHKDEKFADHAPLTRGCDFRLRAPGDSD
jgi:hypothetical protein